MVDAETNRVSDPVQGGAASTDAEASGAWVVPIVRGRLVHPVERLFVTLGSWEVARVFVCDSTGTLAWQRKRLASKRFEYR